MIYGYQTNILTPLILFYELKNTKPMSSLFLKIKIKLIYIINISAKELSASPRNSDHPMLRSINQSIGEHVHGLIDQNRRIEELLS